MSILSGKEIKRLMHCKELQIMPLVTEFDPAQSNTVDLRLGLEFIAMKKGSLPALLFDKAKKHKLIEDYGRFYDRTYVGLRRPFILHPGELVLGATFEYLLLPGNVFGEVSARSSWGRLGLIIATATFVHPGYKGCLTLELANHGNIPMELYPVVPIAQIVFHWLRDEQPPYKGRYWGFAGPTGPERSKIEEKNDIWDWVQDNGTV